VATKYCINGRNKVVDIIDGTATSPTNLGTSNNFVAWGTGAGTATDADTTLFTEASEARVGGTVSQPTADKNQWLATLTADGAKTITNAGVFDASTAGNLVVKGDFTGIVLALNDQIQFTITLQQTSA
jgi:hypothetical protein